MLAYLIRDHVEVVHVVQIPEEDIKVMIAFWHQPPMLCINTLLKPLNRCVK